MAGIRGGIQSILSDLGSAFNNLTTNISNWTTGTVNSLKSFGNALWSGDVVGIDETQIPTMKQGVRDYIQALEDHMAQVHAAADTSGAYKGEFTQAIGEYVGAVCECCNCVISQLLSFNDQLTGVEKAYLAKSGDVKADLTSKSEQLATEFTRYEEGANDAGTAE